MADVSGKATTRRVAVAGGRIRGGVEAFERIRDGRMPKGDPLTMAEIAGIQVFHGDVCVIVRHTQVVDLHDVGMIDLGDHLVFLQETIERRDTLVIHVRNLAQHLQHHLRACRFTLGEIHAGVRRGAEFLYEAVALDQRLDAGRPVAHEQRTGRVWSCTGVQLDPEERRLVQLQVSFTDA